MTKSTPGFDKDLAETLCNLEVPYNVKLSPNGDRVVYQAGIAPMKGKQFLSALWIASTSEAGSARQLTSGQFRDESPLWHPDGQHIAFLSDRWTGSAKIWMLSLDGGGDALQLSPTTNEQPIAKFCFAPDGETIAYLSKDEKTREEKERDEKGNDNVNVWGQNWQYNHLHLLNVKTKESQTIVAGKRQVMDFSWSPDGKHLLFQSTTTPDSQSCYIDGTTISTLNVQSREVQDLCTVPTGVEGLAWSTDNHAHVLMVDTGIALIGSNVVFTLDTTKPGAQLVKAACGEQDSAERVLSVDGRVLVERHVRHETFVTDMSGRDVFNTAAGITSWDVVFGQQAAKSMFAAVLSSTNQPSEVFITKDDQTPLKLSNHGNPLKGRLFGSFRVLTCQSLDGEVGLDGLYLTPTNAPNTSNLPNKPLPTVVLLHGGPADRNAEKLDAFRYRWTPYLLSRGYAILLPQFRGSSGRGEKFASYNKHGLGRYAYEDVIAVTNEAVKKGFADSKRLMVGGWSGGGMLSFLCAVRNSLHGLGWRFNAAISGAGICDVQTLSLTSDIGLTVLTELGGGFIPWSSGDNPKARESSAFREIENAVEESRRRQEPVIPPVLMLHGEFDNRCPLTQSMAFYNVLRRYGLPCELVTFPGQGHVPMRHAHWMDMLERVGRWCDQYIGFD